MGDIDSAFLKRALGTALRKLRREMPGKTSQEALARETGINHTYLSGLERGERDPSLSMLYRLAGAFRISAPVLLRLIDEEHRLLLRGAPSAFERKLAQLREHMDRALVMMWLAGPQRECLYANQRLLEFTGASFDEIAGQGWRKLIHSDDLAEHSKLNERAVARREPYNGIYRMRRPDRSYSWVTQQATPYNTKKGLFVGFLGTLTPVSAEEIARVRRDALP